MSSKDELKSPFLLDFSLKTAISKGEHIEQLPLLLILYFLYFIHNEKFEKRFYTRGDAHRSSDHRYPCSSDLA